MLLIVITKYGGKVTENQFIKPITVSRLLLSLSDLNSHSLQLYYQDNTEKWLTTFPDNFQRDIDDNSNSFGNRIKAVFDNKKIIFPQSMIVDVLALPDFIKKSEIDGYLLKAAVSTNAKLEAWGNNVIFPHNGYISQFQSRFSNANPFAFMAAFCAAVKDNSAALGKNAVLLDVKAIEQIPQVANYMQQFQQHKK
jgi:hypothetical protein